MLLTVQHVIKNKKLDKIICYKTLLYEIYFIPIRGLYENARSSTYHEIYSQCECKKKNISSFFDFNSYHQFCCSMFDKERSEILILFDWTAHLFLTEKLKLSHIFNIKG